MGHRSRSSGTLVHPPDRVPGTGARRWPRRSAARAQRGDTTGCRVKGNHAKRSRRPKREKDDKPWKKTQAQGLRLCKEKDRLRRLQGRRLAAEVRLRAGQDPRAPGDGQLRAASARRRHRRQERSSDGAPTVLGAMKVILQKPVEKLGDPGRHRRGRGRLRAELPGPARLGRPGREGRAQARREPQARPRLAPVQGEGGVRGARGHARSRRRSRSPPARARRASSSAPSRPPTRRGDRGADRHPVDRKDVHLDEPIRSARGRTTCESTCSPRSSPCRPRGLRRGVARFEQPDVGHEGRASGPAFAASAVLAVASVTPSVPAGNVRRVIHTCPHGCPHGESAGQGRSDKESFTATCGAAIHTTYPMELLRAKRSLGARGPMHGPGARDDGRGGVRVWRAWSMMCGA